MHVFTPCAGQILQIGDHVRVTVLESADGRIKLAVEAPGPVSVVDPEPIAGEQSRTRFALESWLSDGRNPEAG